MNTIKRVFALLMTVAVLAGCLAACGGSGKQQQNSTTAEPVL